MDDATDDWVTATSAIARAGSVVAGRYQVRARLGRGGAKEVYLAYDERLDREVALAIIVGDASSEVARSRVEREARVTGRLGDHLNVITVYDTGVHEGVAFLVLRAMAGGSLADAIARRGLSIAEALRLGREIAAALAHAHALGVVHRDVKPGNVWLAADGTAALGDFGIARRLGAERVTAEGVVVGTVRYLSPEQIRGAPGATASDLYSLGVTLYELVVGRPPFDSSDRELVLTQHLTAVPVAPSEHVANVPAALERLILQLLAKDPAQRPASASLVVQELARIESGNRHPGAALVVCPFKGLASFDVADAAYFCGRERLTAELVTRVVSAPLLGVIGPSGSGKSSVLRAGLMRALAEGVLPGSEDWSQVLLRPGRHPLRELTGALELAGEDRVVIAIDQFEETFTTCEDEDERGAFIAALVAATRERDPRCTVLLALRADFYGHCAAYPQLATMLAGNHVLVGAMRSEELRQAIEDPATRAGLHVDSQLTDALVRAVEGAPGALPLLSTALLELWRHRDGGRLTYAAYERTGGVRGAVSRLAEETFGQLDDAQQRMARNVLMRLVDEGAGGGVERRRVELAELETLGDGAGRVVALLIAGRLLTAVSDTVELAHETLLREWPRLQGWIEENLDGLRIQRNVHAAAREWLRLGRDDGALYRGGRLGEALAWRAAGKPALNALEREFLTASEVRRRRDAMTRRRRFALAFSSATIVFVAIGVAVMGSISQRRESTLQRDIAASNDFAERAAGQLASNPGLSRMLALAAYDRYGTDQAEAAVRQATLEDRATAIVPGRAGTFWGLTANRDGRLVAAAGEGGVVRIIDVRRRAPISTIRGHHGDALSATFSPDGARVVTGGEDGGVAIADVDGRNRHELLTIPGHVRGNGGANSVEFSRSGTSLVVGGRDGTVRLIDVASGKARIVGRHRHEVQRAHFNSTGTKVVIAGFDGTGIWDVARRAFVALDHPGAGHEDAIFSPDDARVATVDDRGYLRIWSARTRRPVVTKRFGRNGLLSVRYSRDGRRLVIAGNDAVVRVLDAHSGLVLQRLKGHHGGVIGAAFAAGGTIVSAGADADVRIWTPSSAIAIHGDGATAPELSVDRRHVLWSGRDGGVHRWDLTTGRSRALRGLRVRTSNGVPTMMRASADGSTIAYWAPFGRVDRYDVRSGRSRRVPADATQKFAVALDRSGRRIAMSTEKQVTIRGGGRPTVTIPVQTSPVTGLAFSPDGRHLYTSSDDGSARIRDATTGKRERTLPGRALGTDVAWSSDGRRIVTSGSDSAIRIWPVAGGEPAILYGNDGPVVSAAFDRQGDRIVSAGADGTIRVWDAIAAKQLVVVKRYRFTATGAAFSADGRSVVSAGTDGRAQSGYLQAISCDACGPFGGVLSTARSRAGQRLSPADRRALGLPE